MTTNDIIQLAGFFAVITIFILQNRLHNRASKREIYQRLELASIDLFRFEIENSELTWRLYNEDYEIPSEATREYREMINHVTQIVNLFEMIVKFRNEKIVNNKIFTSWIAWFWEMTQLKNFVKIWNEINLHYIDELKFIIETGIKSNGDWNTYINSINSKYKCKEIKKMLIEKQIEKNSKEIINNCLFNWCENTNDDIINKLVKIFVSNVDKNYISHGEVIDGRASNLNEWKSDLSEIMKNEFALIINSDIAGMEYSKVAICKINNCIVGLAIIEFNKFTNVSILSDIIIDKNFQGKNIGSKFILWIEEEIKTNNFNFIFLESGIKNNFAHEFFEKIGYKKSSVVMVKKLVD